MKSLLSVVLIFGVLAATSARSFSQSRLNETAEPEEYKVYNAVIGNMFADNKITFDFGGKVPVKLLVIEGSTVVGDPALLATPSTGPFVVAPDSEMQADFRFKNQRPVPLQRWFTLTVDYVLVSSPESKRAAYEREDSEVHGIVSFSRVGFNKARTEAYVYMSWVCGVVCGQGSTFWMEKSGETWKVKKVVGFWIS